MDSSPPLSVVTINTLTSILSLESLHGFKTNIQNLFDRQTRRVRLGSLSHDDNEAEDDAK